MKNKTISIAIIALLSVTLGGCNFFGRQDAPDSPPPGMLENGQYVVGTWNAIYGGPDSDRNPNGAFSEKLVFEPNGSGRIEITDPHYSSGFKCIGYGQYRTVGPDIFFYIQAVNNSACGFDPQIHMRNVTVGTQWLEYTDATYGYKLTYFIDRNPRSAAPIGLWDFHNAGADQNGDGGIDWVYFDNAGYFLMQTRFSNSMYILEGYYSIGTQQSSTTGITMTFFNGTPDKPDGPPMVFEVFATTNSVLELYMSDGQGGQITFTGDRL